jgi:hypothetical protein
MTEIGNSIIAEYVSEINERIEDDKNRLRASQALEIARSIWRLFLVGVNMFFLGFVVLAVVILLTIDANTLDMLRAATNEEILSGIKTISFLVQMMLIIGIIAVVITGHGKYFRDKKRDRAEWEQVEVNLARRIIEINEEVLLRHGLIKAETVDNE